MIQDVFRAEGLPLDLAYLPLIESAFKPTAVSRAKAKGVWQFMRGTARDQGLEQNWYVDERSDPEKATQAAAKHLRMLQKLFDGDWHLALASYNGGHGRVQRAMKRSRKTDFWSLAAAGQRYLPRETREYVPMFLAAVVIARNPAQYGFDIVAMAPPAYETVQVPSPLDLRKVAEWTGVSIADIQALNPALRRWTTPRTSEYALKVPVDAAPALRERLSATPRSELASLQFHTVKRGETVASIASKLRVSRSDLLEANFLSSRTRLQPGQQLVVPRAPTVVLASRPGATTPAASNAVASPVAAAELAPAAVAERSPVTYRVRAGDTLSSIARKHDVSVKDIRSWNRLRTTQIRPGDRLTIFPGGNDN
jgi:membrane-bound lytic murein transglycosylase D